MICTQSDTQYTLLRFELYHYPINLEKIFCKEETFLKNCDQGNNDAEWVPIMLHPHDVSEECFKL